MKFGTRVRDIRKGRGLGIKTVGKVTGVNVAYLSRIESGQVSPSEDVIRKLAKALSHDEAELMLLADRVPPAWRSTIKKSPVEAAILVRDSLDSYEAGSSTLSPEPETDSESSDLDESLVAVVAEWAASGIEQLVQEKESAAYQQTFRAWAQVVQPFVPADEKQFQLHVILTSFAFSTLKSLSEQNAEHLLPALWLETWQPASRSLPKPPLTPDVGKHPLLFQRLYSKLNLPENMREYGKVYTPPEIAAYILTTLGYSDRAAFASKLLDPSVGCGVFLIEAAQRICAAVSDGPTAREAVSSGLVGLDNDLTAVCLAKLSLATLLSAKGHRLPKNFNLKIFLADTLEYGKDQLPFAGENPEVLAIKRLQGEYNEGFGFVVGNPPYGKMPSSDSRVRHFKETVFGHANMYGMFLQFSVEHLSEKGKLGFIVPKSFSSGLYFKRLRDYMLKNVSLDEILTFESRTDVFHHSDILQETVVLLCSRGQRHRGVLLKEVRDHRALGNGANSVRARLDEVDFGEEFEHVLCTSASRTALDLLAKVRKNAKPMEALGLRASTGKFVWNRFKDALHQEPGTERLPLYWMHNIKPYRFLPDYRNGHKANFVGLNSDTQSWRNTPGELVLTKRLSAKEQKRRIEACHIPASWRAETPGYFIENHLNFIFKKDPSCHYDMKALTALLNSKLLDFVFRLFNGNTQVSATELNIMPLPVTLPPSFIALANKIVDADEEQVSKLEPRLNEEVYALFRLDGKEKGFVEDYFRGYGR